MFYLVIHGKQNSEETQNQGFNKKNLPFGSNCGNCNTFGDPSEGAARYASYYYGKKLKLHPWLVDWAYSNGHGYTSSAWDDNLTNTKHNYKNQPKNDYNTEKHYEDVAALRKKNSKSKQN